MTRFILTLFLALPAIIPARAQFIEDPTTWTYEAKKTGEGKYDLIFRLKLKEGWHIWSMKPGGDGFQISPSFALARNVAVTPQDSVTESGDHKHTGPMEGVEGDVTYFDGEVRYVQRVRVKGHTVIKGTHEYQVCNDKMCLPPKTKTFVFKIES